MLFKTVLFWMSSTFVLDVYAAAINDNRFSSSPNTEFMDINALTQTPTNAFPSLDTAAHNKNASSVTKRDYNFKTAPYKCHGLDFGYATVGSLVAGIEHLTSSSLKGKPFNGGLNCGRVSCSDNAAIWWCNNNKNTLTLDSFAEIAAGAGYVQSKCSIWDDGRQQEVVSGEASPGPDWTVVVRKNSC